jgi:hypothetical protein
VVIVKKTENWEKERCKSKKSTMNTSPALGNREYHNYSKLSERVSSTEKDRRILRKQFEMWRRTKNASVIFPNDQSDKFYKMNTKCKKELYFSQGV